MKYNQILVGRGGVLDGQGINGFVGLSGVIGMMERSGYPRVRFIELPVESRSRAVALFADIKSGLRKSYLLRELGLGVKAWDDVCLAEFRRFPKEHYLGIISGGSRRNVSRQDLIRQVNELYTLFEKEYDGQVGRRLRQR